MAPPNVDPLLMEKLRALVEAHDKAKKEQETPVMTGTYTVEKLRATIEKYDKDRSEQNHENEAIKEPVPDRRGNGLMPGAIPSKAYDEGEQHQSDTRDEAVAQGYARLSAKAQGKRPLSEEDWLSNGSTPKKPRNSSLNVPGTYQTRHQASYANVVQTSISSPLPHQRSEDRRKVRPRVSFPSMLIDRFHS